MCFGSRVLLHCGLNGDFLTATLAFLITHKKSYLAPQPSELSLAKLQLCEVIAAFHRLEKAAVVHTKQMRVYA